MAREEEAPTAKFEVCSVGWRSETYVSQSARRGAGRWGGDSRCLEEGGEYVFATKIVLPNKGYGLKSPGGWECSLAAISQTTAHMHGHHEATMGLAGVSLGRELRALALSHTASVRRGTA